jgi:nicotinate phosphoribosyltransferase
MKVARATYIAGCTGTSNVLAGFTYGIPVFGTMAHSYVMAFENEVEAFRAFAKTFPDKPTLLIDTYNDLVGAENAAIIAKELEAKGRKLGGVRLDSGDLAETSKKVRRLLDEKGLSYVSIFASGDLDEYRIDELLQKNAKIDAFGVGTRMGTSADRPYVDVIYKLCETQGDDGDFSPIMKLSEGKITLPGRKQVYRYKDAEGKYVKDAIALASETLEADSLLIKVMENGRITYELPSLNEVRSAAKENLSNLPEKFKKLTNPSTYPVEQSESLEELTNTLTKKLMKKEKTGASGKT